MYACIPEIGGGFFQVVCTPRNATAHSCDPPPPAHTSRIISGRYAVAVFGEHKGGLVCLLPLRNRLGAQPQRDVLWLHRLPHHSY